ncbi:ABC transporter permease subunit [Luteitalea sp.]|uniref:ABC transporter permease subunit n=1 Tax=Luteitalea sp. TaxID=2004800 RepID=UPI0025BC828B|nr:ABC transporter permease subunit [Luteitalea sp.]
MLRVTATAVAIWCVLAASASAQTSVLRWGADAEGGAPFVEADPDNPERLRGFDVEIAELLAKALGRTPVFVQAAFTALDQSVKRGDFDVAINGLEDSPAKRAELAVSVPYYQFREVLTVRAADAGRYRSLADLRGRKVATLGATLAWEILSTAQGTHGVEPVSYDDDVHPYEDLLNGRVDAVLLDNVLAERSMRRQPGMVTQPEAAAVGYYVVLMAPGDTALRDQVNAELRAAMGDGRLEAIFRTWQVWNDDQPAMYARVLAGADSLLEAPGGGAPARPSTWDLTMRYLPALVRAAFITLVLSCAAMLLAVSLGAAIAVGRVYGRGWVRALLTTYVEVTRGTPVLLQLFVLYYGLAAVIRLPPFVAALLGLGLNYAAYESEIYRASLEAVPKGQLEAARTLGFTSWQTLRLIRGPQAFRYALAPMTNDFVALLKDSSLVSVLTVVELTKQTQIFAANLGTWALPGALCAAMYLALSWPLARLAARLERRWAAPSA